MRNLIAIVLFLGLGHFENASASQCTAGIPPLIQNLKWKDMEETCFAILASQIQHELTASINYITMSAYFARELNYRPGLSKFFMDSANEERGHAKGLIDYLLKRGGEIPSESVRDITPAKTEWKDASEAIKDALMMEKAVTEKIKDMIKICEGVGDSSRMNDYHAVDHFTGEYLDEQHKGLRQLSGMLSTLERMRVQYGDLAEVMFDKTL